MILTDFYRFEKKANTKSKTRIDCVASTGGYPPLENLTNKKGELFVYIGRSDYIKCSNKRQADLALSNGKHISSIYTPDINQPFGYGDMKGTHDVLIFKFSDFGIVNGAVVDGAVVEVFIARGQTPNQRGAFMLFVDGQLDDDMKRLVEDANRIMAERDKNCQK